MPAFVTRATGYIDVESGKAARDLGWEPRRPTLLEELSNTTVV